MKSKKQVVMIYEMSYNEYAFRKNDKNVRKRMRRGCEMKKKKMSGIRVKSYVEKPLAAICNAANPGGVYDFV